MQKHWDVMRSDNAGDSWTEVSGNLPTDFGFVIDVHAHEPETIYVVPIKSDSEHFPPDGKLRVYRSRSGGNEWEAADQRPAAEPLLRQRAARRDGRRFARRVRRVLRHHGWSGLRVGRCRRQLDADRPRPAAGALSGGPDTVMIRVDSSGASPVAGAGRARGDDRRAAAGDAADGARRARGARTRPCAAPSAIRSPPGVVRSCASSPASRICRTNRPTAPLPAAVISGDEPFLVVGAMAGG